MNIVDYEIFSNPITMHTINCLVLFVVIIIISGWLIDLVLYPDTLVYFLSILLSIIFAFACTYAYSINTPKYPEYKVRITYENKDKKPVNISEKDIIKKIQNNDIATDTKNKNYIYSFEIDEKLYKELKKIAEKRAEEDRHGFVNFTKD